MTWQACVFSGCPISFRFTNLEGDVHDIPWERNAMTFHRGHAICAVEEGGRRFWTASVQDRSGWTLRQEFSTTSEASRYIDDRLGQPA